MNKELNSLKVIIHWTYFLNKKGTASFRSEWLQADSALIIAEDLEKTGRLKEVEFEDEVGTVWTKKELTKLLTKVEDEPQNATVFFDGGYRKNEGLSGLGVAIYYEQNHKYWRIRKNALLQQLESNNEAEYAAFYEALKELEALGVHHQICVFKGDSLVVLNQLSGEWPCYEEPLNRWIVRIEEKLTKLGLRPVYEPISRKDNQEADGLATQALNGEEIISKIQLKMKEY
jgi:ribonuclease HI